MDADFSFSASEFTSLCEVITSFHTIKKIDTMLATVFTKLRSCIDIQGASIALHDPTRKEFYFIRTIEEGMGKNESKGKYLRFPDNKGVAGWVKTNIKPSVVNDVSEDDRFYDAFNKEEDFRTQSLICTPLISREGFLGVLYALNKKSGAFTSKEVKILEILSGTIAVSLENVRLYGELQDHVKNLEREKSTLLLQVEERFQFHQIIGSSPTMRQMFTLLEKIVQSTTSVLIQGETGTGKELIARIIHYNGPLHAKPFIVENCAAIPDDLLESQLFGHKKGAFTGALSDKKGLFELANGGTLFLDEIGEMSVRMQAKLLRVLQEGQFRPVGSTALRQVNVRVIASTNRDLEKEISTGQFREDLYYRINIFQITPPPLRERKEDIPALANHFLEKYAVKNNRKSPILTPRAMELLIQFTWPGNVRELENEMERALMVSLDDQVITPDMLSEKIRPLKNNLTRFDDSSVPESLKIATARLENQMIRDALLTCKGNKTQSARLLGLSRQGLMNKMQSYGISFTKKKA